MDLTKFQNRFLISLGICILLAMIYGSEYPGFKYEKFFDIKKSFIETFEKPIQDILEFYYDSFVTPNYETHYFASPIFLQMISYMFKLIFKLPITILGFIIIVFSMLFFVILRMINSFWLIILIELILSTKLFIELILSIKLLKNIWKFINYHWIEFKKVVKFNNAQHRIS